MPTVQQVDAVIASQMGNMRMAVSAMIARAEMAEALNERLIAEIEHLKHDTYCAYCGEEFALDDEAASKVTEHIKTCHKHPLRAYEAEIERLRKALYRISGLALYDIEHEEDGNTYQIEAIARATLNAHL